jgi:hypothetical protein
VNFTHETGERAGKTRKLGEKHSGTDYARGALGTVMRSHSSSCVDPGLFGNNLIALASDGSGTPPSVWLVNFNGNPSLLAQIQPGIESAFSDVLEGVISLPNNTNQWGPWAGKILTGDENSGVLYTIDTNGTVASYNLGIYSDDFVLIPSNQDLYLCDFYGNSRILKLSKTYLTNYVGDLLITQEGLNRSTETFIVNWNGANFVSRRIDGYLYRLSETEDAAFAPLNLPSQVIP